MTNKTTPFVFMLNPHQVLLYNSGQLTGNSKLNIVPASCNQLALNLVKYDLKELNMILVNLADVRSSPTHLTFNPVVVG